MKVRLVEIAERAEAELEVEREAAAEREALLEGEIETERENAATEREASEAAFETERRCVSLLMLHMAITWQSHGNHMAIT